MRRSVVSRSLIARLCIVSIRAMCTVSPMSVGGYNRCFVSCRTSLTVMLSVLECGKGSVSIC